MHVSINSETESSSICEDTKNVKRIKRKEVSLQHVCNNLLKLPSEGTRAARANGAVRAAQTTVTKRIRCAKEAEGAMVPGITQTGP